MTWDTLFHKEQDAFRREHKKLPKYLYAGNAARKLYSAWFHDAKNETASYGGVIVLWVRHKNWFKFHV